MPYTRPRNLPHDFALKLPAKTLLKRKAKTIRACTFYCFGGLHPKDGSWNPPCRSIPKLAEIFDLSSPGLKMVALEDGWEDHAIQMDLIASNGVTYEITDIQKEVARQQKHLSKLEREHDRCVSELSKLDPGGKGYSQVVQAAKALRIEIEAMKGMDLWRSAMRKAPARKGENPMDEEAGDIYDTSEILDEVSDAEEILAEDEAAPQPSLHPLSHLRHLSQ